MTAVRAAGVAGEAGSIRLQAADEECEAEKTARAIRDSKLNKVKIVKEQQALAFSAAAKDGSNTARLDFLMRQAELFAHFMQSGGAPEKKKRGRKSTKPPAELAAAAAEVVAAVEAGKAGAAAGASGAGTWFAVPPVAER
jgi:hypothetical protein